MISKTYDVGQGIKVAVKITNGLALSTTNNPKATKIMCELLKRQGKKVTFERNYILVEKFDISDEEFSKKLDYEINNPTFKEEIKKEILKK